MDGDSYKENMNHSSPELRRAATDILIHKIKEISDSEIYESIPVNYNNESSSFKDRKELELIRDPITLFSLFSIALNDTDSDVKRKMINFLSDRTMHPIWKRFESAIHIILPQLIACLAEPKIAIRREATQCLHLIMKHSIDFTGVINALIKFGLEVRDPNQQRDTCTALGILLTSDFSLQNYSDLIHVLVKKTVSADKLLCSAAQGALNAIRKLIGDENFNNEIKKLSFPLQKYYNGLINNKNDQDNLSSSSSTSSIANLTTTASITNTTTTTNTTSTSQSSTPVPINDSENKNLGIYGIKTATSKSPLLNRKVLPIPPHLQQNKSNSTTMESTNTNMLPSTPRNNNNNNNTTTTTTLGQNSSRLEKELINNSLCGFIPTPLWSRLRESEEARDKYSAMEELRDLYYNISDKKRVLQPHIPQFLSICQLLLHDAHFNIAIITLEILCDFVNCLQPALSTFQNTLVHLLLMVMSDNNTMVQASAMRFGMLLVKHFDGQGVLQQICRDLPMDGRSAKMKQNIVNMVIAALLLFPSVSFELDELCKIVAPALVDKKPIVQQAGLECVALLAHLLGAGRMGPLVNAVDMVEIQYGNNDVMEMVQGRLARRQLPKMDSQGLVEYAANHRLLNGGSASSSSAGSTTSTSRRHAAAAVGGGGGPASVASSTSGNFSLASTTQSSPNTERRNSRGIDDSLDKRRPSAGKARGKAKLPWDTLDSRSDTLTSGVSSGLTSAKETPGRTATSGQIQSDSLSHGPSERILTMQDLISMPQKAAIKPNRKPLKSNSSPVMTKLEDSSAGGGGGGVPYSEQKSQRANITPTRPAYVEQVDSGRLVEVSQDYKRNNKLLPLQNKNTNGGAMLAEKKQKSPASDFPTKPTLAARSSANRRGSGSAQEGVNSPLMTPTRRFDINREDDAGVGTSLSADAVHRMSYIDMERLNGAHNRQLSSHASFPGSGDHTLIPPIPPQHHRETDLGIEDLDSVQSDYDLLINKERLNSGKIVKAENSFTPLDSERSSEIDIQSSLTSIRSSASRRKALKVFQDAENKSSSSVASTNRNNPVAVTPPASHPVRQQYNPYSGATFKENRNYEGLVIGRRFSEESIAVTLPTENVTLTSPSNDGNVNNNFSAFLPKPPGGEQRRKAPIKGNDLLFTNSKGNEPADRKSGAAMLKKEKSTTALNEIGGGNRFEVFGFGSGGTTTTTTINNNDAYQDSQLRIEPLAPEQPVRAVVDVANQRKRMKNAEKTNMVSSPDDEQQLSDTMTTSMTAGGPGKPPLGPNGSLTPKRTNPVPVNKPAMTQKWPSADNLAGVSISAHSAVNPDDLPSDPLPKPEKGLSQAMACLAHADWQEKMMGLNLVQRLAKYHAQEHLCKSPELHQLCLAVTQECKNLRSQVSRMALNTLETLFVQLTKTMDSEMDLCAQIILQKAGESSGFIREDAEAALSAMVEYCTAPKLIGALIQGGASHKNSAIRKTCAVFLTLLCEKMGAGRILSGVKDVTDRVLITAAQFAVDGNPETRYYGRKIFFNLMHHSDFEKMCTKHISANSWRNVKDIVDNLRHKGLGDPPQSAPSASLRRSQSLTRGGSAGSLVAEETAINNNNNNNPLSQTTVPSPMARRIPAVLGRTSHGTPLSGKSNQEQIDRIMSLCSQLSSTDWRERVSGLTELTRMAENSPDLLIGHLLKICDKFLPRLCDANSKVNLQALQVMEQLLPLFSATSSSQLQPVLTNMVQKVSNNLASKNLEISSLATNLMGDFIEYIDGGLLVPALVQCSASSNTQTKPIIIMKLAELCNRLDTRRNRLISLHVLPELWRIIRSSVGGTGNAPGSAVGGLSMKQALHELVKILAEQIGEMELLEASRQATGNTPKVTQQLEDILQTITYS